MYSEIFYFKTKINLQLYSDRKKKKVRFLDLVT